MPGSLVWPPSELWDFAARTYARPGVPALCLALQDRHGADICLLLLARWLEVTGRAPSMDCLIRCRETAAAWRSGVVGPLRAARRRLKEGHPARPAHAPGVPIEPIRALVAEAELAAERALLVTLGAIVTEAGLGHGSPGPEPLPVLWPEAHEAQSLVDEFRTSSGV